ncbi:hypothetical protein BY996DRAFT_6504370 [Phakopsora pachyrhizi]|nr:hypothetical protein BY996DRAFT_6504370 [Phakopsora pachyrhizi]
MIEHGGTLRRIPNVVPVFKGILGRKSIAATPVTWKTEEAMRVGAPKLGTITSKPTGWCDPSLKQDELVLGLMQWVASQQSRIERGSTGWKGAGEPLGMTKVNKPEGQNIQAGDKLNLLTRKNVSKKVSNREKEDNCLNGINRAEGIGEEEDGSRGKRKLEEEHSGRN